MKLKVQAQHLQAGDIVGFGSKILNISCGAKTPAGKVEVGYETKKGKLRFALWGKYTMIGVERKEVENK